MKKFREFLFEEIRVTQAQLNELEKTLDKLFSEINIDINFRGHFTDRVNDSRNNPDITIREIRDLFRKEFAKYKDQFKNLKPDIEAMLKDIKSKINIPFIIKWDEKNKELDLIPKTIMRKSNFMTRTKTYKV